jgi:mycofactocin system glycosyltransferase
VIPLVYTLRKEVRFEKRPDSWIAVCRTPLNILRIGSRAYSILQLCDGLKSVHEIARETGEPEESVFTLCDYFRKRAILTNATVANTGFFPYLSVIIPTKDRPADLVACLESVSAQDYPKEKLEIIVVDDGSKENIGDRLRSFPCRFIANPTSRGASCVRNRGAREARGKILAFLDNDCIASKAWLRELVVCFQWRRVGGVGGFVDGHGRTAALSRYENTCSPLNLGNHILFSGNHSRLYIPTCNFLVRKGVFDQLGGMQENLRVGEDVDFCWRMQNENHYLLYVPAGVVKHKHRPDLGAMLKRRYDYGTSEALLQRLHPDRKKLFRSPLTPAAGFLATCLAFVCGSPFPLLVSLACIASDTARKRFRVRKAGLSIPFLRILSSVLRTHWIFSHSACFYVLRYGLIPVMLLGVLFHPLWLLAGFTMLVSSSTDYALKRPQLSYLAFAFYYVLDHLAYQMGVFTGCLSNGSFKTYVPRLLRR